MFSSKRKFCLKFINCAHAVKSPASLTLVSHRGIFISQKSVSYWKLMDRHETRAYGQGRKLENASEMLRKYNRNTLRRY